MRNLLRLATMIAVTVGCTVAGAQDVSDAPFNEKWAPTEWGADDKVGAPNRTTPELVLKAAHSARTAQNWRLAERGGSVAGAWRGGPEKLDEAVAANELGF